MSIKTRLNRDLKEAQARGDDKDAIDCIIARSEYEMYTSRRYDRWGKPFGLVSQKEYSEAPWVELSEVSSRCRPQKHVH
jgi:hypothetical protein